MDYSEQLRAALPRWMEDGKGLRGDASPLVSELRQQSFQTAALETTFSDASVTKSLPSPSLGNEPEPFTPQPIVYPWIGQDTDNDGNYMVWFGVGDADFTPDDGTTAASLKAFQARIFDPKDGNASQFFLTVGNGDSDSDGLVAHYGGNTLKATWTDDDEGPELYLEGSDSANVSLHVEAIVFTNSGNTHASGLHAQHLDFDNSKIFLGFDDAQGYELTLTDGSHAVGLHPDHLDFDNSAIFLGLSSSDHQYKLTLNDGTLGCGLQTGYLELASEKVFLGYSSTEGTTHLTIVPDTAYVELGTQSQVFLGFGDGEWHLEISGAGDGSLYLSKDDVTLTNGNDYTDLSAGELVLTDESGKTTINGNTVTIDAEAGGFYIGSVTVTENGLATDSDGGVYIGGLSLMEDSLTMGGTYMQTQAITFIGKDGALWDATILAEEPQSQGDTDALWNLITDAVDDSIRTALNSLTATFTCNGDGSTGGSITFSYSY
jgi:hypothetical protein